MPRALQAIVLLIFSNVFMTFAWYGHLRTLADRPWYLAALVSWGIALSGRNNPWGEVSRVETQKGPHP